MREDNETQGDPNENLLSPETTLPKETQQESLESRDYATVSEHPPTPELHIVAGTTGMPEEPSQQK